jgi:sulfite exporter TauE/SafE
LASYIAGIKAGFRKGIAITGIYNAGRVAAYGVIGTIAEFLETIVDEAFFETYQAIFSTIFAIVIIVIGASIFFKKKSSCDTCVPEIFEPQEGSEGFWQKFDVRAFFMGFTKGFVLCPPLVAFLLYALTNYQANSALLAILFGVGTSLSPMLILAAVVGWLLEKAPLFRKWTSILGSVVLILMGVSILVFALIEFL